MSQLTQAVQDAWDTVQTTFDAQAAAFADRADKKKAAASAQADLDASNAVVDAATEHLQTALDNAITLSRRVYAGGLPNGGMPAAPTAPAA